MNDIYKKYIQNKDISKNNSPLQEYCLLKEKGFDTQDVYIYHQQKGHTSILQKSEIEQIGKLIAHTITKYIKQ